MAPVNSTLRGAEYSWQHFPAKKRTSKKRGFLQGTRLPKLGGAMVLIVGFAVIGMVRSWVIAEPVQGCGEAVNLAGNLRMQAVPTWLSHVDYPE